MRNRTFGHHYGPWMAPFPGHFAFDFDPRGRGRGGRGRGRRNRGDVRAALLALLNERPMHGYEMIQELDDRTGGIWRPSPGSVYPTLQLLEDEGLITSETSEGRKRFTLTDAGREEADIAGRLHHLRVGRPLKEVPEENQPKEHRLDEGEQHAELLAAQPSDPPHRQRSDLLQILRHTINV